MPLIKLNPNHALLREHPFLDPVTQPTTPQGQDHSYIFPGDEIVFCNYIDLPGDAGVGNMSHIKLLSAKSSLFVKKKTGIFSEEFSPEFQSSRFFVLDSFENTFNNFNGINILWGAGGADGYAPRVNFTQDRNFKLNPGDFRRQIQWLTLHTNGENKWRYWFFFPVLFRWEYWLPLITADVDFFDATQPQNGLNHWWYHYFVLNKWNLYSRLDLKVLIDGVPTTIRTELNLTPAFAGGDLNDYNSNTDWTLKSIKTTSAGGTPSNAPCFVYGNKNTEVFAYFSKVSGWAIDEQNYISAVLWVEPFEEAGVPRRTRGSSVYPIDSESVFAGLNTSITDDSGTGITDDLGNYIVTDDAGNGVKILFDGVNPEKVTVFGIIDFNKLNRVYPGVTKFTIYARLYDSLLDKFETIRGEEIKQDAVLISAPPSNALCGLKEAVCPFAFDVFADTEDDDDLKNDKTDFYRYADARVSTIQFVLQKEKNNSCGDGAWEDKATIEVVGDDWMDASSITQSAYGRYFPFGKSQDFMGHDFTDDYGKKYTGLFLEWRKVLSAFGVGRYRMKIIETDAFDTQTISYDEREFCLRVYNCNLANRSVRIETLNIGLRGSLFDPYTFIDYAGGWRGQTRLRGIFRYITSGYVKEYNQYGDTDFNIKRPIIHEQQPKCLLSLRPIPGWMDWKISTEILQADETLITDYNQNRQRFIKFPVIADGDFTPRDNNLMNALSDVEVNFMYALNNLRKRNSQ